MTEKEFIILLLKSWFTKSMIIVEEDFTRLSALSDNNRKYDAEIIKFISSHPGITLEQIIEDKEIRRYYEALLGHNGT